MRGQDFLKLSQLASLTSTTSTTTTTTTTDASLTSTHPSSSLTTLTPFNQAFLLFIIIFYSILVITSLTSNPLLIYVLLWRRKVQLKIIDIFVANLSLSDLFLTIFNIPLLLIMYFSDKWPFGSFLCQLGSYSTSCSIYVNILTMAYISIDRYYAVTSICNPNYRLQKASVLSDNQLRRKIYIALTFIWIVALVLSLPQFFFAKLTSNNSNGVNNYDFDATSSSSSSSSSPSFSHNNKSIDNLDILLSLNWSVANDYYDKNISNRIDEGELF
jgi:hypothetical protein